MNPPPAALLHDQLIEMIEATAHRILDIYATNDAYFRDWYYSQQGLIDGSWWVTSPAAIAEVSEHIANGWTADRTANAVYYTHR